MKVAFIGGGNMAEAAVSGLLKANFSPQDMLIYDVNPSRLTYLKKRYPILIAEGSKQAANKAEVVVLAIKPKDLPQAMDELREALSTHHLVLSMVAGASLSTLSSGLKSKAVVRVMPNINAEVGEAISLWTAFPHLEEEQREKARTLLSVLGKEIYVDREEYLDMATALSGSGPAYVFLFIEALIEAGVYIGLPRELALSLALQTVYGSAKLLQEGGLSPYEAKSKVISPGGTTAQALLLLEESGFRGKIVRAVEAAFQKTKRL